ncbi:MAG: hypothetical protein ACYDC6_02130 [Acidobacteriaceae bacterium]
MCKNLTFRCTAATEKPSIRMWDGQVFSVLDRIALNLLQQDKNSKRGVNGKRLKAGWDNACLLHPVRN